MQRSSLTAIALASLTACATPEAPMTKEPLQVSAAGSLREVLTEIAHTQHPQRLAAAWDSVTEHPSAIKWP